MKSRQHVFWAQTLTTLLIFTVGVQSGRSQNITPAVTAWQINRNDTKGSSTDASIHAVVNTYNADVQRIRHNDTDVYVNSTGVPSYDVGPWPDGNPAIATDRNWLFRIPKSPQEEMDTKTTTPLGNIGVFVNGVPIFNAKDAFSFNNQGIWNQNAVINEADGMDATLGHPAPVRRGNRIEGFVEGQYHHHQRPVSLMAQLGDDGSSHSPIIGFAFDGFPVYGPYGFANTNGTGDVIRIESSYQLKSDLRPRGPDGPYDGTYVEDYEFVSGLGQLDEYNGHLAITPEYPDGIYHYHTTIDSVGESAYPYLVGPQYYGVVVENNFGAGLDEVNIPSDVVDYDGFVRQPGDANEDGQFNSLDIVQALAAAKYETGQPATWSEGDWDGAPNADITDGPPPGNGFFDSGDIVAALAAAKFETGPYAASVELVNEDVTSVPEPSTLLMAMIAFTALLTSYGRRWPHAA